MQQSTIHLNNQRRVSLQTYGLTTEPKRKVPCTCYTRSPSPQYRGSVLPAVQKLCTGRNVIPWGIENGGQGTVH